MGLERCCIVIETAGVHRGGKKTTGWGIHRKREKAIKRDGSVQVRARARAREAHRQPRARCSSYMTSCGT